MSEAGPSCCFLLFVLVIVALLNTNNYFAYHAPGAIAESLEKQLHLDSEQIGLLFTIYSAPNIIMVLIGGRMVDVWGVNKASLFFNSLILGGMILFALAPLDNPMPYFVIGRLLLGLGGESIVAAASTMLSRWFSGTWITFALGFNQAAVQLLGSAASFLILPPLVQHYSLQMAFWVTAGVCAISFVANIIYVIIEKLNEGYVAIDDDDDDDEDAYDTEIPYSKSINYSSSSSTSTSSISSSSSSSCSQSCSSFFTPLADYSAQFWVLLACECFLGPILYTFTAFGPLYFQETFHLNMTEASQVTSVLYLTILVAPIVGAIIDRIGYRIQIQMAVSAAIPIVFICMHYKSISPFTTMTILGFLFAVSESNGVAMLSILSPSHLSGTTFGLLGCGISIALFVEPWLVGYCHTLTGSFHLSTWLFIGLSVAGFLSAVCVWMMDYYGALSETVAPFSHIRTDKVVPGHIIADWKKSNFQSAYFQDTHRLSHISDRDSSASTPPRIANPHSPTILSILKERNSIHQLTPLNGEW